MYLRFPRNHARARADRRGRMLHHRTYKANADERVTVQALLAEHGKDSHGAVTREHPEEQGPLLVDAGGKRFRVHTDGTSEELAG